MTPIPSQQIMINCIKAMILSLKACSGSSNNINSYSNTTNLLQYLAIWPGHCQLMPLCTGGMQYRLGRLKWWWLRLVGWWRWWWWCIQYVAVFKLVMATAGVTMVVFLLYWWWNCVEIPRQTKNVMITDGSRVRRQQKSCQNVLDTQREALGVHKSTRI